LWQGEYLMTVVDRYEEATGRKIRGYTTLPAKEPIEIEPEEEGAEAGTIVRSATAGVMYGARGTRADLPKATNVVACRVTRWNGSCTEFLEHLLGYIKTTTDIRLRFDARGEQRDVKAWRLDMSADADYKPRRTQTGMLLAIAPLRMSGTEDKFLPLDWTSQGQKYVKLSAPESECVAAAHAMRVALRYADSWWAITHPETWMGEQQRASIADIEIPQCVVVRQREDNATCILTLQRGWSAKLSHLPTVYGVSVLWCAERTREGRILWYAEGTANMLADPLTKLIKPDVLFRRGILVVGQEPVQN